MTLKTRKPTGAVPWPLILLEGPEKTGKSYAAALLSASRRVGRTSVIDLSEGAWDEYGQVTGARFEIAEHDGTFASIYQAVQEARGDAEADAKAGKPPYVLVVDPMTDLWELLKDWAAGRARTSRANRAKLERDPNAEITIPMNLWNDANSRHRRLMTALMTFPGIVIVTARGGWVAAVEGGQPVEGKKAYRVEGNKNLGYDVSCWVRLSRDDKPVLVGARSVHAGIRPGIDPARVLPDDWSLEWLIFDALKCDPSRAHPRRLVERKPDVVTPEAAREAAVNPWTPVARLRDLYAECKQAGYDDVTVPNEHGKEELLLALLGRAGQERAKARQALDENDPWLVAVDGISIPEDGEKIRAEADGAFAGTPASDPRLMGIREAWAEKMRQVAAQPPAEQRAA